MIGGEFWLERRRTSILWCGFLPIIYRDLRISHFEHGRRVAALIRLEYQVVEINGDRSRAESMAEVTPYVARKDVPAFN